jgi:hypothetical protein
MKSERQWGGTWLSRRLARGALLVSIPLALVGGVRAVGWTAAQLKQWNDGETLKAADINANFMALSAQLAALTAPLAWTNLALASPWNPYGDGYAPPSCAKDALGVVHLRGLVKGSTASQVTVAVLPPGFRPKYNFESVMACGGSAQCTLLIKATGELLFEAIYPNSSWLSFDGLSFDGATGP